MEAPAASAHEAATTMQSLSRAARTSKNKAAASIQSGYRGAQEGVAAGMRAGAKQRSKFLAQSRRAAKMMDQRRRAGNLMGFLERRTTTSQSGTGLADNPVLEDAAVQSLSRRGARLLDPAHIIQMSGWEAKVIMFLGGYHNFGKGGGRLRALGKKVYKPAFLVCFFACFSVCFGNLVFRAAPFHNYPSDLLTAYIHLPVVLAWRYFRRSFQSEHCAKLMGVFTQVHPAEFSTIFKAIRVLSRASLLLMVALSSVVLIAFAWPAMNATASSPALGPGERVTMHSLSTVFAWWHALVMWPSIPPVVCVTLASYAVMCLYGVAHTTDMKLLGRDIGQIVSRYAAPTCDGSERGSERRRLSSVMVGDRDEWEKTSGGAPHEGVPVVSRSPSRSPFGAAGPGEHGSFEVLLEKVSRLCKARQDSIGRTFNGSASVSLHLLFFSSLQLIVVPANLQAYMDGTILEHHGDDKYLWYWIFGDAFHMATGVALLVVNLGIGAAVADAGEACKERVMEQTRSLRLPAPQRAMIASMLNHHLKGPEAFGIRLSREFAVMFAWATALSFFTVFAVCAQLVPDGIGARQEAARVNVTAGG